MKRILLAVAAVLLCMACHRDARQKEAYVDFLYQYMSLPDKADYPREYYERQVELALQARAEMAARCQSASSGISLCPSA